MADQNLQTSTGTTGAHYTVLARRFRPQAFDDVIGQEHVARALRNAIRAGRVAHAYLFTGARGVGKTSTARILAKALNCPQVNDGVPCNQCEICEGITAGNDVDVLEIDGASNRGIDDIRSLRANVGVRSMRTQYKVYIIDEVHMLTREAFNALLKTLEEPPPNVKFVFCTTEPNKVPDTILSRCQRFDFSAIGETSIAQRLGEIARAEGFEVQDEALELVARRARGSMRDSQSLFDQLLAFSEGVVTDADVHRMLGTAGDERLVELFAAIIEHRPGEVLSLLEDSLNSGVQAGELMDQAVGYVRDLMVIQAGGRSVGLSAVSARFRDQLATQAQRLGMQTIMAAFQVLADARNQMFRSTFGRTILEMSLIQLSLLENLSALSDLLSGKLPAIPELPLRSDAAQASAAVSVDHSTPPSEKKNTDPQVIPHSNGGAESSDILATELHDTDLHDTELRDADVHDTDLLATDPDDTDLDDTDPDDTGPDDTGPEKLSSVDTAAHAGERDALQSSPDTVQRTATMGDRNQRSSADTDALASHSSTQQPELQLTESHMPQLHKLLCSRLGLTIAGGLRQASAILLRAGNVVEVRLDDSYAAARASLESESNRSLIEATIQQLTGQWVSLRVEVGPSDNSADGSHRTAAAQRRSSASSPSGRTLDNNAESTSQPLDPRSPATLARQTPETADAPPLADKTSVASQAGASQNGTRHAADSTAARTRKSRPPSSQPQVNLLNDIDPSRDHFVQHVIETFGARVVKIMPAPSAVPGQAEDESPVE